MESHSHHSDPESRKHSGTLNHTHSQSSISTSLSNPPHRQQTPSIIHSASENVDPSSSSSSHGHSPFNSHSTSSTPAPNIDPETMRTILQHVKSQHLAVNETSTLIRALLFNNETKSSIPLTQILPDSDLCNIPILPQQRTTKKSIHRHSKEWDEDIENLKWKCSILGHDVNAFNQSMGLLKAAAKESLAFDVNKGNQYGFQMEARLVHLKESDWLVNKYVNAVACASPMPRIRPLVPIFAAPGWREKKLNVTVPVVGIVGLQCQWHRNQVDESERQNEREKYIAIVASKNALHLIMKHECNPLKKVENGDDGDDDDDDDDDDDNNNNNNSNEGFVEIDAKEEKYVVRTIIPNLKNTVTNLSSTSDGCFAAISLSGYSSPVHFVLDIEERNVITILFTATPVLDIMIMNTNDDEGVVSLTLVCVSGVVESWEIETEGELKGTKNKIFCTKLLMDCDGVLCTSVIVPGPMRGDNWVCTADGVGNVGIADSITGEFLCNFGIIGFAPLRAVAARSCFNRDNDETVESERGRCTVAWIGKEGNVMIVAVTRVENGNVVTNCRLQFKRNVTDVSITNDGNKLCVSCDDGSARLFDIDSSVHNNDDDNNNSCVILPSCGSAGMLVALTGDLVVGVGMTNGRVRVCDSNEYWMRRGRHAGVVTCVTVVGDGKDKIIVSGGEDGALIGWKVHDGKIIHVIGKGHFSGVKHVEAWAFNMISSIGFDGEMAMWIVRNNVIELADRVQSPKLELKTERLTKGWGEEEEEYQEEVGATNDVASGKNMLKYSNDEDRKMTSKRDDDNFDFESSHVCTRKLAQSQSFVRCEGSHVIDNTTGRVIATLPAKVGSDCAWCLSSSLLVTGLCNGTVLWFDLEN